MRIKLYQCLCENNRMNKESFLYNEIIIDGNSKTPINKMLPSFVIQDIPVDVNIQDENNNDVVMGDDVDVVISFTGQTYNYMYVVDWDRYYFIEPITFTNNKMYIINGTLDTLMSFKNKEWRNNSLYITRRTKGNPFIYDNMIQYEYRKLREFAPLEYPVTMNSQGYNFDFLESLESCNKKYCFIVAYAQWSFDNEYDTPYKYGNVYFPMVTKNSSNSHLGTTYYVCNGMQVSALLNYYYNHSEQAGLVKNIMYLPYEIERNEDNTYDKIGPVDFNNYHIQIEDYPVYETKYYNFDRWKLCDITIPKASSFMDYEPHTELYLYVPFANKIKIDLQRARSSYSNKKLSLYYYVDYETGISSFSLLDDSLQLYETGQCQIGYKFNITTSNIAENQRLHENNNTQITLGTISSILNSSSSGFNPLKLASGIINNVSQYIQRENSIVDRGQASASSANTGAILFYTHPIVELLKDKFTFKGYNLDSTNYQRFVKNIGMPFNDYEFIYNIDDGEHVIVGDTSDIIMSSDVTSQELETFKNALASGFYK